MKEAAWQAFLNSGFKSYSEYIENSTKDIIKKYKIKIRNKFNK